MQLTFMYNILLLYMLIFLVADCVCGVAGTSFLVGAGTSFVVVVGQHEDSWVGSILRHIGWIETRYDDPCGRLGVQHEASYQSRGGLYPHW